MRAVAGYGVAGARASGGGGGAAAAAVGVDAARAVGWWRRWRGRVQLVAFGVLRAVRRNTNLFLAAWTGGTVVRLGLVGVVGFWLWRSRAVPAAPALLGLVGFLFGLLLLEPVFFRVGRQES